MAQLLVKLNGSVIASLALEPGREYQLGRAQNANVTLPAAKGVSRQHFKIIPVGKHWQLQLVARFGVLEVAGEARQVVDLTHDIEVVAQPFELEFFAEAADPESFTESPKSLVMKESDPESQLSGNLDPTMDGEIALQPYLRFRHQKTGREEIVRLEGRHWVIGRDEACEIQIDDPKSSRRHIEISLTPEGYFVTDLGSANGTSLNEEKLDPQESLQLTSGDVIRIAQTEIHFEIRDTAFASRALVPAPPAAYAPGQVIGQQLPPLVPYLPPPGEERPRGAVEILSASERRALMKGSPFSGPNKIRAVIAVLVVVLLYGLFSQPPSTPPTNSNPQQRDSTSTSPTFDQLSPEQKRAVKDGFALIKNLYIQGKYELCLAEIKKLHELVPQYENSKELAVYCKNGADLALRQREMERQQQESAEANQFIISVVEECRLKITPTTSMDELRTCLQPAIERDPAHPRVAELEQLVQMQETERAQKAEQAELSAQRRQAGQRILDNARKLFLKGDLARALKEYERFMAGDYPVSPVARSQAQRDLATVRQTLDSRLREWLSACKERLAANDYKAAAIQCDRILRENPRSSEAKELKQRALTELRRDLKSMYEDSVIEESMGNVDAAKERWKQIMDKSLPEEEYYQKSRRNLRKYGVGL